MSDLRRTDRRPVLLVLSERLPVPPWDGGRLRFRGILNGLTESWRVRLAAFADGREGPGEVARWHKRCDEIVLVPAPRRPALRALRQLLAPEPLNVSAYASAELAVVSRRMAVGAGAAWVSRLRMCPFVPAGIGAVAVDFTDALSRYAQSLVESPSVLHRWYGRLDAGRLLRFEASAARAATISFCASPVDADFLSRTSGTAVEVLPNAVPRADVRAVRGRPRGVRILYVGSFRYAPNRWAGDWLARKVWPWVRRLDPDATLTVATSGGDARRFVEAGARVVFGARNLEPLYAMASAAAVPGEMRGGTRLKLLEAVAFGVPVVATPAGAEGLPFRPGRELLVEKDAEPFARALVEASVPARSRSLAVAARSTLLRTLTWEHVLPPAFARFRRAMALRA